MELLKKDNLKKYVLELKELIIIAFSIVPMALAINKILIPHAIIGGGLVGFCEILYFASNGALPIWLTTPCINIILLIFAFKLISLKFCIRTIFGVIMLTFWLKIIPVAATPVLSDPFMAVVLGGIFNGVGLGMVLLNNGTTGGMDIVATLLNRFSSFSMGRAIMICDFIVIASGWFLPQVTKVEQLLFGLCYVFMSTQTIDWVMNRTKQSVQFFVFSRKHEEISESIMNQVHRGVTILDGSGAYTHTPLKVLIVFVRKYEASSVVQLIRSIDPEAFISEIITESVMGKGFDPIKAARKKLKKSE